MICTRPPPACLGVAPRCDRIVDRARGIRRARVDHADADAARAGDLLVARRGTPAPATLRMRLFAQISTSRGVPRSISSTNVPSPKRPNRSFAWRVSPISPANWPMNSSIASGPTSSSDRVELVGLDRDQLAHAGLDRLRQATAAAARMKKRRCNAPVAASRSSASVSCSLRSAGVALLRRRRTGAPPARRRTRRATARSRAARRSRRPEQRIRAQRMIRPLALQARDQRAFDRGVRLGVECVHQRRADERVRIRQAVQIEPRGIGVDDDAFLHVRDGVGRAGHERLQLVAILARRADRAVERLRAGRALRARARRRACRRSGFISVTASRAPCCIADAMMSSST